MYEIIIGVIGSVLGSIVTYIAIKIYNGGKHFGGVFRLIRLLHDCHCAGIINVFPNRKTYLQHKDHGTAAEYISKSERNLCYVGYWLASSISVGEIIKKFDMLARKQVSVTVVFIDPANKEILEACSKYLNVTSDELRKRVEFSLSKVVQLKKSLGKEFEKYITIKLHKIPLSASAFVIQQADPKRSRVLMDYKLFSLCRDESYGIEYQDATKDITQKAMESYLKICEEAQEYEDFGRE